MPIASEKPAPDPAILIVAAGRGHRAGGGLPKQYRKIGGTSVLALTIERFRDFRPGCRILCVIHPDDNALYEDAVVGIKGLEVPVHGGATRQRSVLNGLRKLDEMAPDVVLIHDAARPFVDATVIATVADAVGEGNGAIAACPVVDTLKRETSGQSIGKTVPRDGLWGAQTPQAFPFQSILALHEKANEAGYETSDDAAVAEWGGLPVMLIESGRGNLKLTTERDFEEAENMVRNLSPALPDIRVGHGYDVHAFEPGDAVILGGVKIPHDRRLKGHSDADVALHTITDAIYGAISDGDIGHHFPPSDPQWKGTASDVFLRHAVERVQSRNGIVTAIDLTIICEEPKIGPHRDTIRMRIADITGIASERISVKATTTEKLGFTGRSEGIAATATATVMLP